MDLSQLKFAVDTTELDRAGVAIGNLVTNVGKLDKASKDVARTEATLAKAAKDNATANLTTAKAQEVTAKATEKTNSILQRQTDIYDFMTQGFSKGQSRTLATAKATGQLSDELKRVLEDMKAFSNDSFDKSELGLKRLQKTMKETVAAQGYFNDGSNLTTKQARELSNDLDRIGVSLARQSKSYQEVTQAQALHKQQFIEEAAAVNRAQNALDIVAKQRKEVVTATNYLTQADQKMAAALNMSNSSLDKAGTDSLVRYESALRKSGMTQDVVSTKLAAYKSQLVQVQAQEAKRAEQHLARALSPQLTDVAVSLYSGQAPLTVLLQQGGQIADLLRLSGVEAQNFGKALRDSFTSMIPVMATVAKGLGGFFVGLFYDAGKGAVNFIGNLTGVNKAIESIKDIAYLAGVNVNAFSKILERTGMIMSATLGAGIFAIIAGLGSLAVGLKQVITENNDLARSFALSGASIGLSHAQVIGYVKTLANSGATTGQATEALVAMAKAGTFTSKEILLVSDSAIQMQKGFGIAIEDTVKQFAKLKEKPVEALLEIAKTSGMVGPEIIKMVQELVSAGRASDAAALAMKTYGEVTKDQVSQMKEDLNGFSLFMVELGQGIKQFFSNAFKVLFLSTSPAQQLEYELGSIRDRIKEIKTFGSFLRGDELKTLEDQEKAIQGKIAETIKLAKEEAKRKEANAESARYEEVALKLRKGAIDALDKEAGKTQTLAEFRKSFVNDKLKDAAREKSVDVEKLKMNTDLIALLEKQADVEFKKNQKKPTANLDPNNIAKSSLASDLSGIKSSLDAQIKAYENGQSILEALRSAGLVDERDYYASKKQFLILENQDKEEALKMEIARLEKEKLIGKDRIDNDRKIAEAKAKLALVREKSANLDALFPIQEQGVENKLAQYYLDAVDSANAYIETLRKAQSIELVGMGIGNQERSRLSGRAQIEDKYSQQEQALNKSRRNAEFSGTFSDDAKKKYDTELALIASFRETALSEYDTYYAERLKQEGDWSVGASDALANYLSETQNVAKSTEDLFTKAFKGMEGALVSFVKTGKLDFASLADSIITDLIRIQIQQSVMPGLSAGMKAGASWVASLFSANGNAFDTSGQVQKFAKGGTFTNQIVDQPTPFRFAKGTGIMGEAGPEAIMPLTRGSDGKLGVQASGSTAGNSIIVNVIESPGNGGQQNRRTENGVDILDVFVEKVKSSIAGDISRGSGAVPNAMANTYGLNRVAGAY
ncbi:MAG: phage tail tape measure protein [Smithella sp.]